MTAGDELNRSAWGAPETVELFTRRTGFMSAGEARVMQRLAAEVRDEPILDIGVGGGRTTEFLRQITPDYVGIDYLETLVAAARRRFPEARFEAMDARDLGQFEPGRFAGVVFSLNGIDGMSHADRGRTLTEIHRVLRPRGWFAYSTLNLAYTLIGGRWRPDPGRTLRHPVRALGFAASTARREWDRRRLRRLSESGQGWARIVSRAYGRPVIWHRVTCSETIRELRAAGFRGEIEVYTSQGADAREGLSAATTELLSRPHSPELHVLALRA